MGKFTAFLVSFTLISGSVAMASELPSLIKCHEALDGKSEGKSEKLSTTSATPFMIPAGKKLYFVTDTSISVLENRFAGKDIVVRLEEKQGPVFSKISFLKDGALGSIGFQDLSKEEKLKAISPRSQLDDESINVVKKDLLKRMNSVTGEYQNKYDPKGTIDSLNLCSEVKSAELQQSLNKQIPFYQSKIKKNGSGYKKTTFTN